jgi:DNA-binding NarL/FixJ family response regulator
MRRVFIVSKYHLFGEGVRSLLQRQAGIEIVGQETDGDKAVEQIKVLRPDVVIVDSADPDCHLAPCVVRIFGEEMGTRIVGLNLENNSICIYQKEERNITGVDDFLKAIDLDSTMEVVNYATDA